MSIEKIQAAVESLSEEQQIFWLTMRYGMAEEVAQYAREEDVPLATAAGRFARAGLATDDWLEACEVAHDVDEQNPPLTDAERVVAFALASPMEVDRAMLTEGHAVDLWSGGDPAGADLEAVVADYRKFADEEGYELPELQLLTWVAWRSAGGKPRGDPPNIEVVARLIGLPVKMTEIMLGAERRASAIGRPCPYCDELITLRTAGGSEGRWYHRGCTARGKFGERVALFAPDDLVRIFEKMRAAGVDVYDQRQVLRYVVDARQDRSLAADVYMEDFLQDLDELDEAVRRQTPEQWQAGVQSLGGGDDAPTVMRETELSVPPLDSEHDYDYWSDNPTELPVPSLYDDSEDRTVRAQAGRWHFAWHCPSPPEHLEEAAEEETGYGIVDYLQAHEVEVEPEEFLAAIGGARNLTSKWWGGWPPSLPTDEEGVIEVLREDALHGPYGRLYRSQYPDGTPVYFHRASGIEHVYAPS